MKFIIALSLLFIIGSLVACSNIKSSNLLNLSLSSSHYILKQDISYGLDSRQKLDVYLPNKNISRSFSENKPLIIFIYGGAWKAGDKKDFKFIGHAFTRAGYRVAIPNYRLYPNVAYPDFIEDLADAVAYIDQHHDILLGSLAQGIVLMGHSAGAHTAALLATDQHYFKDRKIQTKLKGLVVLAGPYDLPLDDPEVIPIFKNRKNSDSVKPVRLVHGNIPATLLLHGQKDTRVGAYHSERFAKALNQGKIPHEVKRYTNVGHVSIIASIAAPLRRLSPAYKDILKFLSSL